MRDLLSDVLARRTLVIATDADYAPMSVRARDGSWSGFDVAVGRELARRLGVRPRFVDVGFEALTGGGWNGRWDLAVDSMTITAERQRVLLLTQPYYYVPAAFAVYRTSLAQRLADLSGRRIGVGVGTTYQAYLEGHLALIDERILVPPPEARAVPYATDALALQDLALGDGVRLDGVLTALPLILYHIRRGDALRVLGDPVFYEDEAIAIDRNSPRDPQPLYAAVTRLLARMKADGTLARLSRQAFGIDLSSRLREGGG